MLINHVFNVGGVKNIVDFIAYKWFLRKYSYFFPPNVTSYSSQKKKNVTLYIILAWNSAACLTFVQVDGGTVGGEETEQGEGDEGCWWKRGWRNQKEETGPNIWVVVFQHLPMDSLSHLHRFLSATYHGLQPTKKVKLMSFFNTQNMCKSTALDWYTKHIVFAICIKPPFFFMIPMAQLWLNC